MANPPRVTDAIYTTADAHEASAMPQARAVHTADGARKTAEMEPLPECIANQSPDEKSPAQWAYERLILFINNFEKQLDNTQEVAMGLTGGNVGVLKIEGLGYFAPDIVTFYGNDDSGANTQLIQHVSQLNVMLVAMPKEVEAEAPRRIGFRLAADLEREQG